MIGRGLGQSLASIILIVEQDAVVEWISTTLISSAFTALTLTVRMGRRKSEF